MNSTVAVVVLTVVAYLCGSVPFGLIFGRAFAGTDVRETGSGNIGAANVARTAGIGVAILTLVGDVTKGLLPVLVGRVLHLSPNELAIIGGAAVLGHDFSIFLKFRGGKGVATTLGVVLALAPAAVAVAAVVWLVGYGLSRKSAVGSLMALWSLPLALAVFDKPDAYIALTFGLFLLALITHRDNLARLSTAREPDVRFQRRAR
jgi:glycerol-3-phosphate acyltransferase PlsY